MTDPAPPPLPEATLAEMATAHAHEPDYYPDDGGGCRRCLVPWPCPTVRLLAEVHHLRADRAQWRE